MVPPAPHSSHQHTALRGEGAELQHCNPLPVPFLRQHPLLTLTVGWNFPEGPTVPTRDRKIVRVIGEELSTDEHMSNERDRYSMSNNYI